MTDIRDFINSFLPDNIPKKKRQQLYDEMECHILDRADFYIEIGYDEETSLKKSMECFGEETEIKENIKADLHGLYHERFYYAVIAGLVPIIFNLVCAFTGNFVFSADRMPDPKGWGVSLSTFFVSFSVLQIIFCFKKGYRKSLVATGISNLLIICSMLLVCYPQSAFYAAPINISYLLEMFTPMIMKNVADDLPDYFAVLGAWIYLGVSGLSSFFLSRAVRKKKNSEKAALSGVSVLAVILCAASVLSGIIYTPADEYYTGYRTWFDYKNDTITEEALNIYDSIPLGCTYEDAKPYLEYLGYTNTEDYISTLSREEQKMFRYNLSEIDFFFSDDYEIFFKADKEYYYRDDNGLFFIRVDKNGLVTGKGIGVGSEYEDSYGSKRHYCSADYDTDKCIADFERMKKGDSKTEVLRKLGEDNGHFYTVFSESENGVLKDYYRIHSQTRQTDTYPYDTDIFIQLWFTDGLLEKGTLEYDDYHHGYEEVKKSMP